MSRELDPAQFGIFAGSEALGEMSDPEPQSKEDFYRKKRNCEYCGRASEIQISWAELYCLSHGMLPQQIGQRIQRPDLFPTIWQYNPKFQCFHPRALCTCGDQRALLLFDMTPTEAERLVATAARNGNISQAQQQIIRAIGPVIQQFKAQRGGG